MRHLGAILLCLGMCACAGKGPTRTYSSDELLEFACRPGRDVQEAKGRVWVGVKQAQRSIMLPAHVYVKRPGYLDLEVTNFLGGTEARVRVRDDRYEIELPRRGEKKEGVKSWRGLPLQWATTLFLGAIPCPSSAEELEKQLGSRGELIVKEKKSGDTFTYQFETQDDEPWPKELRWESANANPPTVDMIFQRPDSSEGSPLQWELRSSEGSIEAVWKDREVNR